MKALHYNQLQGVIQPQCETIHIDRGRRLTFCRAGSGDHTPRAAMLPAIPGDPIRKPDPRFFRLPPYLYLTE